MHELFSDSSATSSSARDQSTCLSDGNHTDNDDSRDFIDLNCDAPSEDKPDYDYDTLSSPSINGNVGSSSCNSNKKHQMSKSSPNKRPSKTMSRIARCTNEITVTIKSFQEELAATFIQMLQCLIPKCSNQLIHM
jgi:hypothetical protein